MSFLGELEAFISLAWPLAEKYEPVERIQLDIDPSGDDLNVTIHLNGYSDDCVEARINWSDGVSDLMRNLREALKGAQAECAALKVQGDEAEECRKQIKALDVSPLEELAQQAE
jgi:hypothetical protein